MRRKVFIFLSFPPLGSKIDKREEVDDATAVLCTLSWGTEGEPREQNSRGGCNAGARSPSSLPLLQVPALQSLPPLLALTNTRASSPRSKGDRRWPRPRPARSILPSPTEGSLRQEKKAGPQSLWLVRAACHVACLYTSKCDTHGIHLSQILFPRK